MNLLLLNSEFDNIKKLKEINLDDFEKTLKELEEAGVNVTEHNKILKGNLEKIMMLNLKKSDQQILLIREILK